MNASVNRERLHRAYLCLGSNIAPAENMRRAVNLLREQVHLLALSTCWETQAVTSAGSPAAAPNFLNAAAYIETDLDPASLKAQVLAQIEQKLGRVRTDDKYAPRTIDLDIIIFDEQVIDAELWERPHLALPFSELLPGLRYAATGETLARVAERLRQGTAASPLLNFWQSS